MMTQQRRDGGNFFVAIALALLPVLVASVWAQPDDTVYVQTNKPQRTFSRYYHWKQAAYLWTVSGSGVFGTIVGDIELTADSRFSLVSFAGLPQYPKLPLEDNGWQGQVFCNITPAACWIFFATNARVDRNFTLEDMQLDVADSMKKYRFIPENDTYNPQHVYTRTVYGNDVKAQFLYIDRYGEANNQYYFDNTAVFRVVIQRKSPELLVIQPNPYRILNDGPPNTIPNAVFREEVLNFGQAPVGGGATIQFRRILKNRGLEPLRIRQIVVAGTNIADFTVQRTDGAPLTQTTDLQRWQDSVELVFQFQPTSVGAKQAEVLVFCNDPTQNPGAGETYFRFLLQGEGVQAQLSVLPEIDFGDVWVGQQKDTTLVIRNIGNTAATLLQYTGVADPFFLTNPVDTNQPPQPPAALDPGRSDSLRIVFRPTQKGRVQDTLRIAATNTSPYSVVLRGRGLLSAAKIWYRWQFADSLRDTIDFGQVSEGEQRIRAFTIRNLGNVRLTIPEKVVPYYEVVDIIPGSKDEFVELFQLGCDTCFIDTLTPYYDKQFAFLYDGTLTFPVGKKAVRLRLSVRQQDDTSKIVAQKEFVLIAEKIPVRLNVAPVEQDFDSVYIHRTSPPKLLRLLNISKQHAIWIDTILFIGGSITGEFRIAGGDYQVQLAPEDSLGLPIVYQPADRGWDTARLIVRYHSVINGNRRDDSVTAILRGIGVEQQLLLEAAVSGGIPPEPFEVRRGLAVDTIDVGAVRVGRSQSILAFVRNLGNLVVHPAQTFFYVLEELTPNALLHYQVVSPHDSTLAVGQRDTVHLLFQPKSPGQHAVRYVLSSNVPDRIGTAPDSIRQWSFVVVGRGIRPEVMWSQQAVDFGDIVVLQNCPDGIVERSVRLTNAGDAPVLIVAAVIVPNSGVFTLQGMYVGKTVEPGEYLDFPIRFAPPSVGTFTAELVVHTDEAFPYKEYRIQLEGQGIAPPVVPMQLPTLIRVRPGRPIALPIRWATQPYGNLLQQIDTIEFALRYNKTLLEYQRFEVLGTAAENATVDAQQTRLPGDPQAVLAVRIAQPDPLLLRDTLIVLWFDTFLGTQASTEVTLNDTRVVVDECEGVVELLPEGGAVTLDSLCGLEQKLAPVGAYRFRLQTGKHTGAWSVEYEIPFDITVQLELFTLNGIRVWEYRQWHPQAGRYVVPLPSVPPGVYLCRMSAGIFSKTVLLWRRQEQ